MNVMWNFVLCNVDVTIVGKILKNLDVAKPSGIYQFKDGTPVIVIHLVNIINVLIKLDTFSPKYKIAKVKPLSKKGIKTKAKNYRPISLLPLISKVIEKSIHDQTQDYLKRNELLYFYQSGFRANHSAGICLFNDTTLNGAESRKHTGIILINLQKAFDTLDQTILLDKMKSKSFQIKQ